MSSDDPRLAARGVPRPKAEISNSYSVGLTGDIPDIAGGRVSVTIDALQIDTRTRGVDVIATYKAKVTPGQNLTLTLAGTRAQTVCSASATPRRRSWRDPRRPRSRSACSARPQPS